MRHGIALPIPPPSLNPVSADFTRTTRSEVKKLKWIKQCGKIRLSPLTLLVNTSSFTFHWTPSVLTFRNSDSSRFTPVAWSSSGISSYTLAWLLLNFWAWKPASRRSFFKSSRTWIASSTESYKSRILCSRSHNWTALMSDLKCSIG